MRFLRCACHRPTHQRTPPGDQKAKRISKNLATIRSIYDAFASGDVVYALTTFHENVEWNEAEHVTFWPGRPLVGHQEVVDGLFARIPQSFGSTGRSSSNECTTAAPP